jgi:hypothetical protein
MRNRSVNIGRRCFFRSIVGLAISAGVAKLPFEIAPRPIIPTADHEFVIVNGWVLTRDDLAVSGMTADVV